MLANLQDLEGVESNKLKLQNVKYKAAISNQTERRLNRKFLQSQLVKSVQDEPSKEIRNLRQTSECLKAFIVIITILALPFFRKIDKEDINLEKPFLSYDLANATGIDALKDNDDNSSGSNSKRWNTTTIDSSKYTIINSFNTASRSDSLYPETITTDTPITNIDTILKQLHSIRTSLDTDRIVRGKIIDRIVDGNSEDADRIKTVKKR